MDKSPDTTCGMIIRPFAPEDVDYVINGQLKLYEAEFGFDSDIWKAYVTDGVHELADNFDNEKDCMYILEHNGTPSGCAAITRAGNDTAKFRFFFVEQALRGRGAGRGLLRKALDFCREKEYRRVILWTFSTLYAARHLYESFGFKLTETSENGEWGTPVTEEKWELEL
jgi:GNAT superfamily N-acetyltransferase